MTLQALVWDVDGTLAETEDLGHRIAFNLAFEEAGMPWRWDSAAYGELLRVTGGKEPPRWPLGWRTGGPGAASSISIRSVPGTKTPVETEQPARRVPCGLCSSGSGRQGPERGNDQKVKIMPTAKPSPLMLVAVVSSTLPYSA